MSKSPFDDSTQQTMLQMEMLREIKAANRANQPVYLGGGGSSSASQGNDLVAFIRLVVFIAAVWFCWRLYKAANEPEPTPQAPPAAAAPANASGPGRDSKQGHVEKTTEKK
jgi:hypothetical protein